MRENYGQQFVCVLTLYILCRPRGTLARGFEKNNLSIFFAHQNSTTPPKKEQIHHELSPAHAAGKP